MSKLCSVICPTYNHAKFAAAGLQSIYDQTHREIEIIVIDDGSTDENVNVIREKLELCPFPSRLITQANTGNVPANINKALSYAKGEFLTFLSLDDLLLPGCIKSGVDIAQTDSRIVFAANTGHQEIDGKGVVKKANEQMPIARLSIQNAQDLLEAEYEHIGAFYIQGQIFRRDAVQRIGGFEDSLTGDDIILRTKLFRYLVAHPDLRFSLGNETLFAYRKHEDNLHKQSFRQIRTVIEWREIFFPDRPYPPMFFKWLEHFFVQCQRFNREAELQAARAFNPIVEEHYGIYRKQWKYRRRMLKSRLRRALGMSRAR